MNRLQQLISKGSFSSNVDKMEALRLAGAAGQGEAVARVGQRHDADGGSWLVAEWLGPLPPVGSILYTTQPAASVDETMVGRAGAVLRDIQSRDQRLDYISVTDVARAMLTAALIDSAGGAKENDNG